MSKRSVDQLLLLLASSSLISCATVPVNLAGMESGHFTSKVLIRDLQKNKSQVLNVEVKALDLENLRLDVTSSLGLHVFSLVNRGADVEYIVVSEKKHYMGKSDARALAPVFAVQLDPRILGSIFFERPIADKNWTCDVDKAGRAKSCRSLRNKAEITWEANKDGTRLIEIQQPKVARIQINIRSFEKDLKDPASVLKLKVPKSFTRVKI